MFCIYEIFRRENILCNFSIRILRGIWSVSSQLEGLYISLAGSLHSALPNVPFVICVKVSASGATA